MQLRELIRILLFGFAGAFFLYVVAYRFIEGRRVAKGPWQVHFESASNQPPSIKVTQPNLGISNVTITFPDAVWGSNVSKEVAFDLPTKTLPFGKKIFIDTTFLPGTLTMELFTHEVELLPRVLYIDRKQFPWQSNTNYFVRGTTNIPPQKKK